MDVGGWPKGCLCVSNWPSTSSQKAGAWGPGSEPAGGGAKFAVGSQPRPCSLHRPLLKGSEWCALRQLRTPLPQALPGVQAWCLNWSRGPAAGTGGDSSPGPGTLEVGPSIAHTGCPWGLLPDPWAIQVDPECRELDVQDLGIIYKCLLSGA